MNCLIQKFVGRGNAFLFRSTSAAEKNPKFYGTQTLFQKEQSSKLSTS